MGIENDREPIKSYIAKYHFFWMAHMGFISSYRAYRERRTYREHRRIYTIPIIK